MVYSSENSKWKAYEFSDPFAAGSFYVCNKVSKFFCRPDCDARPITNLKSEIKFVTNAGDAISLGYTACEVCDPTSLPSIDVDLLIQTVASINDQIGFLSPLLDENEERNNQKIKANIIESKRSNEKQILKVINNSGMRRSLVPVINFDGKLSKDAALSKNDSDHYRIVDLACRHLALAAAVSIYSPVVPRSPGDSPGSSGSGGKKRRRRGGVLGFKELAAKSKLSAWHFHRVFKSVIGLTPKTYGDKCWEYIKKYKDSGRTSAFENFKCNTPTPTSISSNNQSSVPTSPDIASGPPSKRIKKDTSSVSPFSSNYPQMDYAQLNQSAIDNTLTPPIMNDSKTVKYSVPQQATFDINQPLLISNFNMFESDQMPQMPPLSQSPQSTTQTMPQLQSNNSYSRAFLAPDLTKYGSRQAPVSLFSHSQRLDERKSPIQQENIKQEYDSSLFSSISPTVDFGTAVDDVIFHELSANTSPVFSNMLDVNINAASDAAMLNNQMKTIPTNDDYNNSNQKLSEFIGVVPPTGFEYNDLNKSEQLSAWTPEFLSANIGL